MEERKMIYLQATVKLRPGKREEFVSLLNTLLPVVKEAWA